MKIYVVQPGDTLWLIANRYGVSIEEIIAANGLDQIPYLIPGQSLVIPTETITYTVQPGDTLYLISQRFNVTIDAIINANNIQDPNLIYPGTQLVIPSESEQYGTIEVNGYIIPQLTGEAQTVDDVGDLLTYISPFSYTVNADGTINTIIDSEILDVALANNIAPLMVITNFAEGNFSPEIAHTILADESIQEELINNILEIMENRGYYGLNVDLERIPPEDRELYNQFLEKLTTTLNAAGYIVSVAVVPKPYDIQVGEWHGAIDYAAIGEIVDFVILMTYDWGWAGGPPFPIAPIDEVRAVIDYALSVMPREKIMMGVPFYGYDWTLPYAPENEWASLVNYITALQRAAEYGSVIQYDQEAEAPFYQYLDETGVQHQVWFEDARSLKAKYDLVNEYGLRGVSYWVMNLPAPQNWPILDALFNVEKLL